MDTNRHRPTIGDNPQVGPNRHNMYKDAIDRYLQAMESGFYIEAISLMESLTADRLESLLNAIVKTENISNNANKKHSYLPLSWSMNAILKSKIVQNHQPIVDVLNKIENWINGRNSAIHEMAKLSDKEPKKTFAEKYEELKSVAEDGYKLFREFDNELSTARKNKILP